MHQGGITAIHGTSAEQPQRAADAVRQPGSAQSPKEISERVRLPLARHRTSISFRLCSQDVELCEELLCSAVALNMCASKVLLFGIFLIQSVSDLCVPCVLLMLLRLSLCYSAQNGH
jgi:hypothetical protein